MINKQLLNPKSIVVVGGSDNIHKPGGKVLKNIIDGKFKGDLYVANPKENEVQGVKSYKDPNELPEVDLAILAIAAKFCPDTIRLLAEKRTQGLSSFFPPVLVKKMKKAPNWKRKWLI